MNCGYSQRGVLALNYFNELQRIMAKPWMWVGLDTDATAGRNENVVNEMSSGCAVGYELHDCVEGL